MATEILVPTLGESVSEATVAQWLKKPGEAVAVDEPVVELETDKVTLEVGAPQAGVLAEVIAGEGDNVEVGALLGRIENGAAATAAPAAVAKPAPAAAPAAPAPAAPAPAAANGGGTPTDLVVPVLGESVTEATVAQWLKQPGEAVGADEPLVELETDKVTLEVGAPAAGVLSEVRAQTGATVEVGAVLGVVLAGAAGGAAPAPAAAAPAPAAAPATSGATHGDMGPAVRKMIADNNLDPGQIPGSGKDGRITKEDVQAFLAGGGPAAKPMAATPGLNPAGAARSGAGGKITKGDLLGFLGIGEPAAPGSAPAPAGPREERVRMPTLRQTVARRLKEAQNTAAMLTTYNEADMSAVKALRSRYRDRFEQKYGVRLGFMSFFVKAAINALQAFPAANSEIDGEEIVYKHHYDIGVAVSTSSGLVVPVVRDADQLSFADLEKAINDFGLRARDGQLAMEDLMGGTFTISNGGVFGSLMSSPILNPPQVGILGMHKIQDRPMAVDGEVAIRPMMYLALSYDHRIVDGREAVSFLVRIKECIEDPERLLLDL